MGTLRTSFAWLIALSTVGLVSALPHVTLADDVGPGKEVRAIRHDLPILIAGADRWFATSTTSIDGVVVDGNAALVQWHDGAQNRLAYFARRYDRWWLDTPITYEHGMTDWPSWCSWNGPSSAVLRSVGVPGDLVAMASRALPAVVTADAQQTPAPAANGLVKPGCHHDAYDASAISFERGDHEPAPIGDGYAMHIGFASSDAPKTARLSGFEGRAPTEAESWVTHGGNSYFFFSATVQSDAPIHVEAGTTLDVWFPFVLDPSLHYALTLAYTDKPIGPLDGVLKDNVVHFTLPAFAVKPGAHLMGEIEGDAWPHYAPQ